MRLGGKKGPRKVLIAHGGDVKCIRVCRGMSISRRLTTGRSLLLDCQRADCLVSFARSLEVAKVGQE